MVLSKNLNELLGQPSNYPTNKILESSCIQSKLCLLVNCKNHFYCLFLLTPCSTRRSTDFDAAAAQTLMLPLGPSRLLTCWGGPQGSAHPQEGALLGWCCFWHFMRPTLFRFAEQTNQNLLLFQKLKRHPRSIFVILLFELFGCASWQVGS